MLVISLLRAASPDLEGQELFQALCMPVAQLPAHLWLFYSIACPSLPPQRISPCPLSFLLPSLLLLPPILIEWAVWKARVPTLRCCRGARTASRRQRSSCHLLLPHRCQDPLQRVHLYREISPQRCAERTWCHCHLMRPLPWGSPSSLSHSYSAFTSTALNIPSLVSIVLQGEIKELCWDWAAASYFQSPPTPSETPLISISSHMPLFSLSRKIRGKLWDWKLFLDLTGPFCTRERWWTYTYILKIKEELSNKKFNFLLFVPLASPASLLLAWLVHSSWNPPSDSAHPHRKVSRTEAKLCNLLANAAEEALPSRLRSAKEVLLASGSFWFFL